ncbi:sigma-70 family RNA polymerase sigma factor [Porphyrobacter sp. YT40]|uniref:sigma-70 family RNA polymerase sigma factor n=1 Tax=Porphyrobacter sp. YT40 TaxID=2547601 RepID=UPI00114181DF|nr:sigma-70 family RNA polymerase sigma factor [Porphyrobacter sp. YT40]QDH35301.1 sigma-70 family RNA polymerase sigma factor [Porphyrobacter sp. YT40]
MDSDSDITRLLGEWRKGDEDAEEALVPLVYDELHRQARRLMAGERAGHTIQPTALVHDAYLKLRGANVDWADRTHFFALSARLMRRLLVNHANARAARKRGGGDARVTLEEGSAQGTDTDLAIIELDEALQALRNLDPDKAQLIELQYFGGLSVGEMQEYTGLSSATIGRHLRFARAWMRDFMESGTG